jgi:hypothetical protein
MKTPVIALLLTLLLISSIRAQDSTRLERVEYVLGASAAFSLIDFLGFNITRNNFDTRPGHSALEIYHLVESSLGVAIDYLLYEKFGIPTAISFDLLWWTWVDDLGFYGWTNLINPPAPSYNRTNNGLQGTSIDWAGWTPIGLLRPQGSGIARSSLIAQAVVGFSISIAILW